MFHTRNKSMLGTVVAHPKARVGIRSNRGSMMILGILCCSFALLSVLTPALRLSQIIILQEHESRAVEAASLAACAELSKIVINDPYFGYISLVNSAPCGRATAAGDGEPLPVLGINTMLATSREQAVFAEIADNDDLRAMAARELQEALRANKALFNVLLDSLRPKSEQTFRDADGMLVEPYKRALKVYLANGGCALKTGKSSESRFSLRLGWLEDVTNSGVRIPQPENICKIEPEQKIGDNYRAGVDLPVNNLHFFLGTFANHVSLADCSKFMRPDGKRICSVVRADSNLYVEAEDQRSLFGLARQSAPAGVSLRSTSQR